MGADGALAFEEAHDVGDGVLGWDFENHVHMVGAGIALDDLDFFLLGQFSDDLANLNTDGSEEYFLPVFGYNDHVVGAIPYHMAL